MWASSAGFSLLELIIALVLGLIVMLAAVTVLISAQRMLHSQYTLDEVQQHAYWGLAILTQDIRQSNFNMPSGGQINNQVNGSGIIFSQANLPESIQQNIKDLATQQAYSKAGTLEKSDQLLIQYRPFFQFRQSNQIKQNIKKSYIAGVDCEGRQIEENAADVEKAKVIVNRYFVAPDPQQIPNEPTGYSLFCESGWYRPGDTSIHGLNGGGQQLIKRVDAFKLRLGVQAPDGRLAYMTVNQYQTLMAALVIDQQPFYQIISVELGFLIRASMPSTMKSQADGQKRYMLLDQMVSLSSQQQYPYYLRQVVSQVVALRNTQKLKPKAVLNE